MEDASRHLIFAMAGSPAFARVRDARDLSAVPVDVQVLSLENASVGDSDVMSLPRFLHLRCLDLDGTQITDAALDWVAQHPTLEELWVECTAVTDSGLAKLARLSELVFVSAAHTDVTASGAAHLQAFVPGAKVSV